MITDGFGSSETGAQGSQRIEPGADVRRAWHPVRAARAKAPPCWPTTAPRCSPARASSDGSRSPGRIPLGYHNDPEKTAETFVEVGGVRWVVTGDMATVERRRVDHPARPRLGVDQHRRREGVPRGGRVGAEGAPRRVRRRGRRRPRRAVGRAGVRGGAASRRAPSRRSSELSRTAGRSSPGTSCPASWWWSTRWCARPVGKADYRWAKRRPLGARPARPRARRTTGPLARRPGRRDRRPRAGAVRRDGAGRPGRRGPAHRAARQGRHRPRRCRCTTGSPPTTSCRGAACRPGSTSSTPTASRSCGASCREADVFVEGFRPGVAERLGIGPDVLCDDNPRLIYGRMTGWGQDGPLADEPGHDITYLALAGRPRPHRPGRPAADAAAQPGGRLRRWRACCWRSACAPRWSSGRRRAAGQVVDAAMVDGAALLMAPLFGASRQRVLVRRARHQPVGLRRAVLRLLRVRRRPVRGGGRDRAAVLRRAARRPRPRRRRACPTRTTRPGGPSCERGSARSFARPAPATSGPSTSSSAGACVAPVLTMAEAHGPPAQRGPAARSSRWPVRRSPRRRRGSQPHLRRRSTARRSWPAPTPTRSLGDWGVDERRARRSPPRRRRHRLTGAHSRPSDGMGSDGRGPRRWRASCRRTSS